MTNRADVDPARSLLNDAIAQKIFPAAVAEVGDSLGPIWREAFGRLTFDDSSTAASEATIFDLASLTKPIATTSLVLHLAAAKTIDLHQPLSECFQEWRGSDREASTVRDLLEHATGLAARLVDPPPLGRREFEHEICAMRLDYEPRTKSVYSDLGFILLGFLAEDRGRATLAEQFDRLMTRLTAAASRRADLQVRLPSSADYAGEAFLAFEVPAGLRHRTAPTLPMDEDPRRGEVLIGKVHDDYAAALGGAAGHAGLFGNATGLGVFARAVLRASREDNSLFPPFTYPWVMKMSRRSTVPDSSRGLGWDTMLPSSSCGAGMSPAAFGHVGYTGTSLWIDPILDRYFVLLTNRAYDGGSLDQMRDVRRAFHDRLVSIDES
jgi:CubicO group peptidase (beta-lactamase class C family)